MNEENKNTNESQEKEYAFKAVIGGNKNSRIWSVVSLVVGIISVIFSYFSWFALVCGLVAVALAVFSRITLGYFEGISIAGLIVGIFGLVFGAAGIVAYYALSSGGYYETFLAELGNIFGK